MTPKVRLRHPPDPPPPRELLDIDPEGLFLQLDIDPEGLFVQLRLNSKPVRLDFKDCFTACTASGARFDCKGDYCPVHILWLESLTIHLMPVDFTF